ncbi:hypothetical protein [Bifidobacterium felsineum]|uniref:hypothetical protein n=1 Tax=Bifidobacterium felsineum TaxID=2045440 RepID=UPI001BDCB213|nr:hypothetical protein [Bifidobacterium felsineum]MBT1164602.1 hypothetical protein [Bifidobacterium felsineum]
MTLDELIEQLETLKRHGMSGNTPLVADCWNTGGGWATIDRVEADTRMDLTDLPDGPDGFGIHDRYPVLVLL